MLKAFLRDGAVYGIAKLMTGGIALIALPIYTHALVPADYGVVDLLTTVASVAHVTVALEIAQGLARYAMAPESAGIRDRYASTALWFTLAAYSLFVAIAVPFARPISASLAGSPEHANTVRVASLVIWTTGTFNLLQNLLRYQRRTLPYALASVVFSATSLGVTSLLLLVFRAGLVAVFIGQLAAGLLSVGVALIFLRDTLRATFDRELCRKMLAFSVPLVPSGLGVMLCLYVDRYAVMRLLSVADVGLYGVAFRLASMVAIAVAGFQMAIAPLVYQNYDKPETPAHLARMFQWFLAMTLPLVLFLGLFARELVAAIAPVAYLPASRLVFLLSVSSLVSAVYNFSPGLWIAKRTGWVALISLGSGLANLGLNFVVIPHLGLIGAALATFISALAAAALHFVLGQVFYKVPFRWGRIASVSALAIAAGLAGNFGVAAGPVSGLVARGATWLLISTVIVVSFVGVSDLVRVQYFVAQRIGRRRGAAAVATESSSGSEA